MVRSTLVAMLIAMVSGISDTALRADSARLVALTFDDGPRVEFLEKALPYFAREEIKVTFFVIGEKARASPAWIKRVADAGHEIENHTLTHRCLVKPSPKWNGCADTTPVEAVVEVETASRIIESITGRKPKYVRPPYFAMTAERKRRIEQETDMTILLHDDRVSIGSLDWSYRDSRRIEERVIRRAEETGYGPHIVVFHETDATLAALPEIIAYFKRKEYRFVTLEELARQTPATRF